MDFSQKKSKVTKKAEARDCMELILVLKMECKKSRDSFLTCMHRKEEHGRNVDGLNAEELHRVDGCH
jgi:hypothetical protein